MIEFKAECGHTVRARDEDSGGVVRCSYCGRTAPVPDTKSDELDFLLDDLKGDRDSIAQKTSGPAMRKRGIFGPRKLRRPGRFDPFAFILRLCYVAALVIILVVVAKKFVIPMFKDGRRTTPIAKAPTERRRREPKSTDSQRSSPTRMGLSTRAAPQGLYVSSTPPGAQVYFVSQDVAPERGRIDRIRGAKSFRANTACPRVNDGTYLVEVVFAWNDPRLTAYRDYTAFRRKIEHASDSARRRIVDEYFIPDKASDVFITESSGQLFIVRQYRNVEIRQRLSSGIRALFLPRLSSRVGAPFPIKEIVRNYLPQEKTYRFDENYVRGELDFWGVAVDDQPAVISALARIGAISYVTPDERTRLFKIGIHDGVFIAEVVRQRKE